MKKKTIGLLGAAVNNANMGCVALTYSLLQYLEEISKESDEEYSYYIFEGKTDNEKRIKLCDQLRIDPSRISCYSVYFQYSLKSGIFHFNKSILALNAMRKCDLFIDLTSGDSFTDIYGKGRFDGATKIKEYIERKGWPLILGPQTYGPFNDKRNAKRAKHVIESAVCVIARDQASAEYLRTLTNREIYVTTDLAFALPFEKRITPSDKIRVGLNISSLLLSNKTEPTQRNFQLRTDYDQYTENLLYYLCNHSDRYDIYIIPHVGVDGGIQFKDEFPELKYVCHFEDPISAKSFISNMDIFIGARMHATIGAFSSGVATIPVAYSRKFTGLFDSLSHEYVVDLQTLSTEQATDLTIKYLNDLEEVKRSTLASRDIYMKYSNKNYEILRKYLLYES